MSLLGKFVFHNVGQGLFYSGLIKYKNNKFSFIYDCGGSEEYIKCVIDDYLNYLNEKNTDMLVISHFHKDHINGLEYLLKKNKPKYVFLPYFTEIERLYILTKNLSFAKNNHWYLEFLQDPTNFLIEYGINKNNIYYIHPSNHNGEDDIPNVEDNDNFELQINLGNVNNEESLEGNHKSDKGDIKIKYWMFRFFCLKKDLKEFKDCILDKKLDIKKVDLSDKKTVEYLKQCYKKIKGNFNDTSLVMLHKPLVKIDNYEIFYNYFPYKYKICYRTCFVPYGKKLMLENKSFAQILTGDINLKANKNYKEFKNHYKNYLKEVCVFQIPHHGAKSNWNKNLLQDIKNCYFWIANAGKYNKYNHPSFSIFLDVIEEDKCFICVNESPFNRFILKIRS
ncbi:MBL fold metallo-hydrolase [Caminibacter mediatlanticus TB-2]|uniref:MBL fold metallo-hydrolase n=1 Tax=Caminibacter mediatlanticus TB-2 TaxID=391592 RepID=A0ABX5VDN8_9BACT|nr:MBL fold metallo-hydrolase [Caminibacter mediatlanticus]QCT94961.1 MBL fold metallo-hydrolase [Caminibacter mediatlanticus TB-2]